MIGLLGLNSLYEWTVDRVGSKLAQITCTTSILRYANGISFPATIKVTSHRLMKQFILSAVL